MKEILKQAYDYGKKFVDDGNLVNYIPALANVDKSKVGIAVYDNKGNLYEVGDTDIQFSIMSIAKISLYAVLLENYELDYIREYIGVKGSSKAYNSIVDLEESEGKLPINPFINAGALMTSYFLFRKFSRDKDKTFETVLEMTRKLTGNNSLTYSVEIYESSKDTGYTNLAIMYTMQKNGVLPGDIDVREVLEIYNKACTIMINTKDLAYMGSVLARGGINLKNERILTEKNSRVIRTLMAICGTYDYSGDFAVDIGIPAKSGVGGGILATTKDEMGIATYCPGLDSKGNSLAGIKIFKKISNELEFSIY